MVDTPVSCAHRYEPRSCSGVRPHQIAGVILRGIRRHFSSADNLEDRDLREAAGDGRYLWKGFGGDYAVTAAESGILIEEAWRWSSIKTMSLPAIVVARGRYQVENDRMSAFDDSLTLVGGIPEGMLPNSGKAYVKLLRGQVVVPCLSTTGGAAELLTDEVERLLRQTAPIWKRESGMEELSVTEVAPLREMPQTPSFLVGRVAMRYSLFDTWSVSAVEPRLAGGAVRTL